MEFLNKVFRRVKSYLPKPEGVKVGKVGLGNKKRRNAWIESALKRIPKGNRILDAGAGELQYKKFTTHLEYVSQDLGEYDGQGDDSGLHTSSWDNSKLDIVSDIIDIPVEDKSFDAVMCTEVFEHIVEPAKAVEEFARIIKPGGYLIITSPFASMTHFAPFYYANGYSRYWYKEVLERNGFKDIEIDHNGNYFEYVAQEVRRINKIANQYSSGELTLEEKRASRVVLRALNRMSQKDGGSEELLHAGNHVFARKSK